MMIPNSNYFLHVSSYKNFHNILQKLNIIKLEIKMILHSNNQPGKYENKFKNNRCIDSTAS